jgi:type VI protein secretion system component Hcp
MKSIAFAVSALVFSAVAAADRSQGDSDHSARGPQSTITVAVNGLSCASVAGAGAFDARSWSWGASNSSSSSGGGGSGVGKAVVSALSIKKGFDACSPTLFAAVTTGRHFQTLTLTDRDNDGTVVATVTLTEVLVSSWSVGSTTRDATPDEAVTFTFRKVCLAGSGSTQICFDAQTNTTT